MGKEENDRKLHVWKAQAHRLYIALQKNPQQTGPFPLLLVSMRHRWCSFGVPVLAVPFHCSLTMTDRMSCSVAVLLGHLGGVALTISLKMQRTTNHQFKGHV